MQQDPGSLIEESEHMLEVRRLYEKDPASIADFPRSSPNLEAYIANLKRVSRALAQLPHCTGSQSDEISLTPYGMLRRVREGLFDEDDISSLSVFQRYKPCMIMLGSIPSAEYWEYTECGRQGGCTRTFNPGFAAEILHNANYRLPSEAYKLIFSGRDLTDNEKYLLVLNSLQNDLIASLATEGTDERTLIIFGYTSATNRIRDFGNGLQGMDGSLKRLNNLAERNIKAINSALGVIPADLALAMIANINYEKIADELPVIAEAYARSGRPQPGDARLSASGFNARLRQQKKHMQLVDRIFSDERLLRSIMADAIRDHNE